MSQTPPRRGKPAKPKWAIARDRAKRSGPETVWLFGLHAVRDALANPRRQRHRLIVTPNAAAKLAEAIAAAGIEPEIADPRKFTAPLDPQSVHQGAALEASRSTGAGWRRSAPRPALTPRPSSSCSTG